MGASLACRAVARGSMARLRPLGSGAAAFTRFASEGRSSARAYQNIAGYGRRPWAASLACRAVARGSMARLRPLGSGAAAFTRFASEGWWAMTGSNRRPPRCKRGALPTELIARADQTPLAVAAGSGHRVNQLSQKRQRPPLGTAGRIHRERAEIAMVS